jgi:hypothetical protein
MTSMPVKFAGFPVLVTVLLLAAPLPDFAQQSGRRAQQKLPPLSWVCPMVQDVDVLEDKPGPCPKCKMNLVPVRLDSAWSCPIHPAVIKEQPGTCPIDKRDLAQVTVSLYWTCAGKPDVHEMNPGKCADGEERVAQRERRAHGDHNPRHGGQFFMAPDNWHHLEGTHPRAGLFRVFMYDDYTRPVAVKGFTARAVTREQFDSGTGTWREIEAFPLKPSRDGKSLEARIDKKSTLPVQVTTTVRFEAGGPEHRFDFAFPAYTKEPAAGVKPTAVTTMTVPTPATPPSASPTSTTAAEITAPETTAAGSAPPVFRAPGFSNEELPNTPDGLLAALTTRSQQVATLLDEGALGQVYIPALESKDVALALETHAGDLSDQRRVEVTGAVKRLVLAAWQIDFYGDLGNKEKLTAAYTLFAAAVADIRAAYAGNR